jgi:thiol-disulfide isomerase/thioredoxin
MQKAVHGVVEPPSVTASVMASSLASSIITVAMHIHPAPSSFAFSTFFAAFLAALASRLARVLAGLVCALPALALGYDINLWPAQKAVPAIAMTDLNGQSWTSAKLKGRVVILNFWATWCEPCRAEMPSLVRLADTMPHEQLVVLAVNYQEHASKVRRFFDAELLDVPPATRGLALVLDNDGNTTRAWTNRVFPTSIVIDTTGKPRLVVTGEYDWASPEAQRLIVPLLLKPLSPLSPQ